MLPKLPGKAHFVHIYQTDWVVHGKSQEQTAFYGCAHDVMGLGTWVNLTALEGRVTDGRYWVRRKFKQTKTEMAFTCIMKKRR